LPGVRALIIALPPLVIAAVLLAFFCAISAGVRRLVQARCGAADAHFLARGDVGALPSMDALNDFEDALNDYVNGAGAHTGAGAGATSLRASASTLVSSVASVSAVAHRALPWPLAVLLGIVAVLVTAVMGTTTVTGGRPTMVFVYVWCLIPALSLTAVAALAFPFALRSGMTLAPLRAVADSIGR